MLSRGGVALRRCYGCEGLGHFLEECHGRSLPRAGADGFFSAGSGGGALKRGGGPLAGAPAPKAGNNRGGGVLGCVNGSMGPVGGAPMGARG